MKVRFLSVAEDELDSAAAYYYAISPKLSGAFLREATRIRSEIRRHPRAWHPIDETFRQCRFRRFPYAFIYDPRPGEILVVAVAHLKREPGYWRGRIVT